MHWLIHAYNLNNLIDKPACFQSNTPTCIDLILINRKNLFKLFNTFETGISDHHKLVSTILKSGSFKGTPKIKIYRSYKKFELENFNRILKDKLENPTNHSYADLIKSLKELIKDAPLKKVLRHNNNALMTKELRKEIGRKLCCDQNSKINLIRKEIISTGAIISVSVIIA